MRTLSARQMVGWKTKNNNSSTTESELWRNPGPSACQLQENMSKSGKIWCAYLVLNCVGLQTFWTPHVFLHLLCRSLLSVWGKAETRENDAGLRWSFVSFDGLKLGVDLTQPRTLGVVNGFTVQITSTYQQMSVKNYRYTPLDGIFNKEFWEKNWWEVSEGTNKKRMLN